MDRSEYKRTSEYYQEGRSAFGKPFNCPYISGQKVYGMWIDGYVDAAVAAKTMPADAPPYIRGQIAYGLGYEITDKPAEESFAGRWVRGWMIGREAAMHAQARAKSDSVS